MDYNELVNNHSSEVIERVVTYIVNNNPVEVLFNFEDDDQWAIISMHQYEEDLEISIRLHVDGSFDLYLGYYDDEDDFHELVKPLTEEEVLQLPEGLKKVMKKVVEDEKGMRLSGALLGK